MQPESISPFSFALVLKSIWTLDQEIWALFFSNTINAKLDPELVFLNLFFNLFK